MTKKTIDKICLLLNNLRDLEHIEQILKVNRGEETTINLYSEQYRQRLDIKVSPEVLERVALKIIEEVETELKELGYTEDNEN
jgi:hypothetical protein